MSEYLFQYHKVHPTTWVYLSSLLTLGLFFKFSRFWSVRNLDLVLLILLAPGLLLVQYGGERHAMELRGEIDPVPAVREPSSSQEEQPPRITPASSPLAGSQIRPGPSLVRAVREGSPAGRGSAPAGQNELPGQNKLPVLNDLPGLELVVHLPPEDARANPSSDSGGENLNSGPQDSGPQDSGSQELVQEDSNRGDAAASGRLAEQGLPGEQVGQSGGSRTAGQDPREPAAKENSPANEDSPANEGLPANEDSPATEDLPATEDSPANENASANESPDEDEARSAGEDPQGLTSGQQLAKVGFLILFGVGLLVLIRALIDPTMVRRPLLEPNLSTGGLTFIGCSLFVFLMANVLNSQPTEDDLQGVKLVQQILARQDVSENDTNLRRHGPGYAVLNFIPSITTMPLAADGEAASQEVAYATVARIMAILSHLAIVSGIVAIGYRHFGNIKMGIGAATLYLMLPYTAQMTGRVDHVLPSALLVWAVLCYRRPLLSGMFIGLSIGVVYYPLFLLPLWLSFYWHRGLGRFLAGVLSMLAVMVLSLTFISSDVASFLSKVQQMFGLWIPYTEGLAGIWGLGWAPAYRLPVLAAFIALCGSLAIWPAQKNLGTLLSCSAAVMVATQFWHGFGGGTYMAWYLPLILLTIFRPNLEDRVALSVLGQGWFPRRARRLSIRAA